LGWGFLCRERTQRGGDRLQNTGAVLNDLVVPEAEDAPALSAQCLVSGIVIFSAPVLSAVGFDDEVSLNTGEIHDIRRDRVLTPEAPPELFIPKPIPKHPLRSCRVPAQTTGASNYRRAASHVSYLHPPIAEILSDFGDGGKFGEPPP